MIITICVLLWILCGIVAAGLNFAYFQGRYPSQAKQSRRRDLGSALLGGLIAGPIALLIEFFDGGFAEYGWRLW